MERPTVSPEISRLFFKEFQKSVTSIASLKFCRLHTLGSDRIPLMLLVISEGCLNAITTVIYRGKIIVESPRISSTKTVLFDFPTVDVCFITAPPLNWKISSAQQRSLQ